MKAAVYLSKRHMEIEDVPVREPKPDEVVVKVAYCGICQTDVHIFNGEDGAYAVHPPLIPGHEFSGTVVQKGSEVESLEIGDRVSCDPNDMCGGCDACLDGKEHFCRNGVGIGTTINGGFAEYVTFRAKSAYRISDQLDLMEAAMAEPLSCCLHGIDLCHIRPGDTVLVIGGGPIGMIMLQLARISGAAKIILSEPVKTKRDLAEKLGANITVNPQEEDVEDVLHENTDNVDVVIECLGNPKTQEDAVRFAGNGATVMFFGLSDPGLTFPLDVNQVFKKELKLTSSYINPYTFGRALKLLEAHVINVKDLIAQVLPLESLPLALGDDSYRRNGKVIIRME